MRLRVLAALAGLVLLGAAPSWAQAPAQPATFAVTGTVADTSGTLLPGANAVLLQPADSVLVSFGTAGADGAFRIRRVRPGAYLLRVTFVGYAPHVAPVEVGEGDLDVGRITLRERTDEIGRIVVTERRVAVAVRGDTLEYDPAAFPVRAGATVEDLLRRLPGVEVGRDGQVTAQGQPVRRVLVDGEEFFPDSPTAATRNLPADIVDRVQMYDERPEGGAGGLPGERTINLSLKPDRRTGTFGLASAGAGRALPQDAALRYTGRLSANRFAPGARATFIGNANNINEEAFSRDDYLRMMGGAASLAGDGGGGAVTIRTSDLPAAGDGFVSTWAGGGSGTRALGARTRLQASYLGFRTRSERDRRTLRRLTLGDAGAFRETDEVEQDETRHAHRLSLTSRTTYGENHDLQVWASVRASASDLDRQLARERFAPDDDGADGGLVGRAASLEDAEGLGGGGDVQATYRRRLGAGLALTAEGGAEASADRDEARLSPLDGLGSPGGIVPVPTGRTRESANAGAWTTLRAVRPLGAGYRLSGGTTLRASRQRLAQAASFGEGAEVGDLGPERPFVRTAASARAGAGVDRTQGRWEYGGRLDVEGTRLDGGFAGAGALLGQSRLHVLPSAQASVTGRRNQRLALRYAASVRAPSARQLSPVTDAASPFQRFTGNPGLREERTHQGSAQYTYFDLFTSTLAFAFAQLSHTPDAITNARLVRGRLVPEVTPVHFGSRQQLVLGGQLGTPLGRHTLRVSPTLFGSRGWEVVDDVGSRYAIGSLQADVGVQARTLAAVELDGGARLQVQTTRYSGAAALSRTYASATPYLDARLAPEGARWDARLRAEGDVRTRQGSAFPGANTPIVRPLLGLEASWAVGPRGLRLHLAAADLLDQTRRVDYRATAFQTEETTTRTLGRHVYVRLARNL